MASSSLIDHSKTYSLTDAKNIVHILRLRQIFGLLRGIVAGRRDMSLCDVGCSNGFITGRIKAELGLERVAGMDRSDNVRLAQAQYPDVAFSVFNLNTIAQAPPARFDIVTCFETLEHVGSLGNALTNLLAMT